MAANTHSDPLPSLGTHQKRIEWFLTKHHPERQMGDQRLIQRIAMLEAEMRKLKKKKDDK